jgi:glyoxylase-like metal-dependent hydrolase (beta-lactamase superfamily II)
MLAELAAGLWRWTARHPEWHPGDFGAEVVSYALRDEEGIVLVDPLLPADDPDAVHELVEDAAGSVLIVITIPYHVRDAGALARRYRAEVVGHAGIRRRLPERGVRVRVAGPGDELRGGMRLLACGKPRRSEQPLWVPQHRALVFGDAVVEWDGALRVWAQRTVDDGARAYFRERFAPSLAEAVALDPARILVTHGEPVLSGGAAALEAALAAEPWNPPGHDGAT